VEEIGVVLVLVASGLMAAAVAALS